MWGYSDFDDDRLRRDMEDYYGTAMFNGFPMAMMDLHKVHNASNEELRQMAMDNGVDLNKYRK